MLVEAVSNLAKSGQIVAHTDKFGSNSGRPHLGSRSNVSKTCGPLWALYFAHMRSSPGSFGVTLADVWRATCRQLPGNLTLSAMLGLSKKRHHHHPRFEKTRLNCGRALPHAVAPMHHVARAHPNMLRTHAMSCRTHFELVRNCPSSLTRNSPLKFEAAIPSVVQASPSLAADCQSPIRPNSAGSVQDPPMLLPRRIPKRKHRVSSSSEPCAPIAGRNPEEARDLLDKCRRCLENQVLTSGWGEITADGLVKRIVDLGVRLPPDAPHGLS